MFCITNILCVSITALNWLYVDASNEFELRLQSSKEREGRVEVFQRRESGGVWGNICDNEWDEKDALVACRQLGFANVGYPVNGRRTNNRYGSGFGVEYFYSEFQCNGSENALRDCPHVVYNSRTEQRCTSEQAAGLMCFADFDVRLDSKKSTTVGTLEIFYKGEWTNVRSEDFDDNSADVACMQVQDGQDKPHTDGIIVDASTYGSYNEGNCQFSNFNCQGNETHIRDCDYVTAGKPSVCVNLAAIRCDDPCSPSPCRNDGLCEATAGGSLICRCISGYSGDLCTIGGPERPSFVVDINEISFQTIVLAITFGLVGLFLLLTLLTTVISRFAFQNALERIIFDADQELASKDQDNFDRHVIDREEFWGESEYEGKEGIKGFGEDEEEYIGKQETIYHKENDENTDKCLGKYDERFDGSIDV